MSILHQPSNMTPKVNNSSTGDKTCIGSHVCRKDPDTVREKNKDNNMMRGMLHRTRIENIGELSIDKRMEIRKSR